MKHLGLTPDYAKYVAATIEPSIDQDVCDAIRGGKAKTEEPREVVKQNVDRVVKSLREIAAPLAAFATAETSAKSALQMSPFILADVEAARGDVTMLRLAIERALVPALIRVTDPIQAVSVRATLAGFVAGLEASVENVNTFAEQAVSSADQIVDALMTQQRDVAKDTHDQAKRALEPGLKELDDAVASLEVIKKSLF
jgi:hypothetical protein